MKIPLSEHKIVEVCSCIFEDTTNPLLINEASFAKIKADNVRLFKIERGKRIYPFLLHRKNETTYQIQADYYIGVDWLIPVIRFVQVEPKVNKKIAAVFNEATDIVNVDEWETPIEKKESIQGVETDCTEIDYIRMLMDIMSAGLPESDTKNLVLIDWNAPKIMLTQKEDRLTPFLIVQFLQLLKIIVQKGLKKSYYKESGNLNSKLKGKILIGGNIKQNVLKNQLTKIFCEYQVFGQNNADNRFLKEVFRFASSYLENNKNYFASNYLSIVQLIKYCQPAFEQIVGENKDDKLKETKFNPFFKAYKEAIVLGKHILNRFAYNITETSTQLKAIPPFWIDMPRMFELYCYVNLLKANPEDKHFIHYQFSTYGNALDILVSKPGFEIVIDAKYKMQYHYSQVHEDIRQVSGYARLRKVRDKLRIYDDKTIDCLILYPDLGDEITDLSLEKYREQRQSIPAYHKIYKMRVGIPRVGGS